MNSHELQAKFAAHFPEVERARPDVRGYATMRLPSAEHLPKVARWLKEDLGYTYLEMLTAVDWLGPADPAGLVVEQEPHACGAQPPAPEKQKPTPGVAYRDRIELVYCLCEPDCAKGEGRVFLKVDVPRAQPRAPSLTGLFKGADWQEREVYDLFGVSFAGHPNLKKILTPAFLKGHPLRKDYAHVKDRFD